QRLSFVPGEDWMLRLAPDGDGVPSPAVDVMLAFYLTTHGALSLWARLKWLVDLVPLFSRFDAAQCRAFLETVRGTGTESSVAASLLLLRQLFAYAVPEGLSFWLDPKAAEPAVARRLSLYSKMISRR